MTVYIYWILLAVCPLVAYIAYCVPRKVISLDDKSSFVVPHRFLAFLSLFILVFFVGLRSGLGDTPAYIRLFDNLPADVLEGLWSSQVKDKGFTVLTYLIKYNISQNYHVYLFILTAFSTYAVGHICYRYSSNFPLSIFLFISSAQFTWLMNGIRQYLAVTILFLAFPLLLNKKIPQFLAITLITCFIHGSVLIVLPLFFVSMTKPFTRINWQIILLFIIAAFSMKTVLNIINIIFKNTQYTDYNILISETEGSNIIRLIVAFVPVIICFVNRKRIYQINDSVFNYCINMSMFNCGFLMLSTVLGGLYFGRMSIYCETFNLILYPLILHWLFRGKNKRMITAIIVICFVFWFWYQMMVAWKIYYYSDILHIIPEW